MDVGGATSEEAKDSEEPTQPSLLREQDYSYYDLLWLGVVVAATAGGATVVYELCGLAVDDGSVVAGGIATALAGLPGGAVAWPLVALAVPTALATVLLFDSFKRGYAIGLLAGGLLVPLATSGTYRSVVVDAALDPNTAAILTALAFGVVTAVIAVAVESFDDGSVYRQFETTRDAVTLCLLGGTALVLIDALASGTGVAATVLSLGLVAGTVFAGLCLVAFYDEHQQRVLLLGPQRSGKSATLGGLQLAVEETYIDENAVYGATNVGEIRDCIEDGQFPPPTGNREYNSLRVEFRSGTLFPTLVRIDSVDYSGEAFDDIIEPLVEEEHDEPPREGVRPLIERTPGIRRLWYRLAPESWVVTPSAREQWAAARERMEAATYPDAARAAVTELVEHADRLFLVVPLDDFVAPVLETDTYPKHVTPEGEGDRPDIVTFPDEEGDDDGEPWPPETRREALREAGYSETEVDISRTFRYVGGEFYHPNKGDRPSPARYLDAYRTLAMRLGAHKDVDLLVTMGDWAENHYYQERNESADKVSPREFAEFIFDNYIDNWARQYPDENDASGAPSMLVNRHGARSFVVWYDLDEDGQIERDGSTPLNGAYELISDLT